MSKIVPFYNTNSFKLLKLSFEIYKYENNLLLCKGHFNEADLPANSKNPTLLPKEEHLIYVITRDVHFKTANQGLKNSLNQTRSKFRYYKDDKQRNILQ